TSRIVPAHQMGLDGVLTEHHCHGIVDVSGRYVAVHVDILQSLNKSLFGTVDHRVFEIVPDTPTCKFWKTPDETALAQRRSAATPIRMTIPPASSLTLRRSEAQRARRVRRRYQPRTSADTGARPYRRAGQVCLAKAVAIASQKHGWSVARSTPISLLCSAEGRAISWNLFGSNARR